MIVDESKRLYVVDVCGTIVRDDTTLGFLHYHFSMTPKCRFRKHIMNVLTMPMSPFRLAIILLEKMTGRHILKHMLVWMLRGEFASELFESGKAYAHEVLGNRRVPQVWKQLDQVHSKGEILLASAGLEPVVQSLAEIMGVRYVSSTLDVRDGKLTGRYHEDLTGKKIEAIAMKYGADELKQPFVAISDNLSDRRLLEMANEAFVVLHKKSHRSRWNNLQATFLSLEN